MESENNNGSIKNLRNNDGDQSDHNNDFQRSNSSASSYSSSLSDSNPLELDINDKDDDTSVTKSENDDIDDKDNASVTKFENDDKPTPAEWSMMSLSPRAGFSSSEFNNYSPVSTSPPLPQVMGKPPEYPGYDPNRIPTSVFVTNKPASGMEWSLASNESLFSIHMGNNSFTRDHFNWMKSGELKSPDEFMNSSSPGLPPITETSTSEVASNNGRDSTTSNMGKKSMEFEEVNETDYKERLSSAERNHMSPMASHISDVRGMNQPEGTNTPTRVSHQSDGSRMSNSSFAFQVFGGETPSKPTVQKVETEVQPEPSEAPQKTDEVKWFTCCFSCWPFA